MKAETSHRLMAHGPGAKHARTCKMSRTMKGFKRMYKNEMKNRSDIVQNQRPNRK